MGKYNVLTKGILLCLFLLCLHTIHLFASGLKEKGDTVYVVKSSRPEVLKQLRDSGYIAVTVDENPKLSNDKKAWDKYIYENMRYPEKYSEDTLSSRNVELKFIITEAGKIKDISILNSINPDFDAEVVRLISSIPQMIPGKKEGKNVETIVTTRIVFSDIHLSEMYKDRFPVPIGGWDSFYYHLFTNLKYPLVAQENGIEGEVIFRFVISKEGKMKKVKLHKGLSLECDAEVERVLNSMPNWEPNLDEGQPTEAGFELKIRFKSNQVDITDFKIRYQKFGSIIQKPRFPAGDKAIKAFIEENLNYPEWNEDSLLRNKVQLKFIVTEKGNIENVTIVRGINPIFDKEAIRVVKSFPQMIPAMKGEESIPLEVTYSVVFDKIQLPQSVVDRKPSFVGGDAALAKYIIDNLQYPEGYQNEKEVAIKVRFLVDKDGKLKGLMAYGKDSLCNAEAKRLVSSMPDWLPAISDGEAIANYAKVVVNFRASPRNKQHLDTVVYIPRESEAKLQFRLAKKVIYVDQAPIYPAGEGAMKIFIERNIRYPDKFEYSKLKNTTVIVQATISEKGVIESALVRKGITPQINKEIIRLLGEFPRMIPGKKDGKAVKTVMALSIELPKI